MEGGSEYNEKMFQMAFLFWFFRGFRCGVPLFIVFLDIYKIGKNRC